MRKDILLVNSIQVSSQNPCECSVGCCKVYDIVDNCNLHGLCVVLRRCKDIIFGELNNNVMLIDILHVALPTIF